MYGFGFVARQFSDYGGGVLAGFEIVVLRNLLYVLKRLRLIDKVFMLTEINQRLNIEEVIAKQRPCVVLMGDVLSETEFHRLLTFPKVMVIVYTQYIMSLPYVYLEALMVLLWNMSYRVDVPFVASRCRLVDYFMRQERLVLLTEGPIFLNGCRNICITIELNPWVPIGRIVTQLQRRFRRKKHCATVIQRRVKQWLYRPDVCLGQKIVTRLNGERK
jgi:hypothetical protein